MNILNKYDSWDFERLSRHLLYWSLWSAFYIFTNFLSDPSISLYKWATFEFSVLPIKISCAYVIAYILMPAFLYKKRYVSFFISSIYTYVIFGSLLYAIYRYWVNPVILNFDSKYFVELPSRFTFKVVELVYITGIVVGVKFFQNLMLERRRNHQLREKKTKAELKYLKNQIQPHFLFNTLNNLYGLVLTNDPKAPDMLLKLSDVLSYILYDSDVNWVRVDAEIDNLENYIAIEKLRYNRKLDLVFEKTNVVGDLKISPLLLIPFVENAFKHGPGKSDEKSWININIKIEEEILYFSIENSYQESTNKDNLKSGIGLANIKKRLELIYPSKYDLQISKNESFSVLLELDLSQKQ